VSRHAHPAAKRNRRSSTPECRRGSEAGDTLLEILIAIVVLGLASVALIVGFGTSISSSAEHRNLATFDTILATASQEAIAQIQQQQSLFQTCPPSPVNFYQGENASSQPPATSLYMNIPSPYTSQYTVTYTGVLYWDSAQGIYDANCVVDGYQAQLITITATDLATNVSYTNSFVVDFPSASSGASQSGSAYQLFFEVQPGPPTCLPASPCTAAGIPLGFQPVIDVEDGSNIPVTTDLSPVTLTLSGGTPGATLTGCSGNEVLGVVTFTGCTVSLPGTGYTIIATDGSLPVGSQTAISNPFNVGSSAPALVFKAGTPVAAGSGSAFATQPVVQVELGGVPDTTWTGTISLTSSGGVLSGCSNLNITTADAGVANVTGCSFEGGYVYNPVSNVTEATVYFLTAAATGVASGTSGAFSVTSAGPASQLVFSTQPTGVASSNPATPFTGQPAVTVEDAFGNPVTSGYAPTISITAISVGTLSGCTSSNANGVTTFSGCAGSAYGDGITITASASSGGLSVTSAPFNITGGASKLVFTTQPQAGVSGTDFLVEPVIAEEDALGNIVTSATAKVTLTPSAGGTLSFCSGLTPVNGLVTVTSCNFAGIVGTTYTLTASATGLTSATSNGFKVTSPGTAATLVFTTQPVAGASQSPLATQPVLTVLDSGGNVVTTANVTVTLTPSGGTLASCNGLTAVAGVINVANCTFGGVVGTPYTMIASANGLISVTSHPFSPTGPGPASQIVLGGCSSNIFLFTTCTATATVEDASGNIVTTDNPSVTFTQISGSGAVTGLSTVSASGGVASDLLTGSALGPVILQGTGGSFTSSTLTITIVGFAQTITWSAPGIQTWVVGGAGTFSLSAGSDTSGSLVTFASSTQSVCTVIGTTVTMLSAGTCTITPTATASGNYALTVGAASNITISQINQAPLTITSTNGTYGSGVTLATSGGTDGGAVSYVVTNGTATGCSITSGVLTSTSNGTCLVTATMAGNTDYNPVSSSATTVTFAAGLANTITVTSTAPASATVGGATYTPSASATSGDVVAITSSTPGVCAISGGAVSFTAAGPCTLDFNDVGNATYLAATQQTQSFTVGKGTQATIILTSTSATYNGTAYTVTLTTSGGSGTGAVSYTVANGTASNCTISGALTLTASTVGTCMVTATRAADANYLVASSAPTAVTFLNAAQTVSFYTSGAYTTTTTAGTATYSASGTYQTYAHGSASGTITFASTSTSVCTVDPSAGLITFVTSGTCTVTAVAAGIGGYLGSGTTTFTLTITAIPVNPQFVGISTAGGGSPSGTNLTLPVPTGVSAGDLLIAVLYTGDPAGDGGDPMTVTMPTGWTVLPNATSPGAEPLGAILTAYHVASASEPASYTFNSGNFDNVTAVMLAYVNPDGSTPSIDKSSWNTTMTSDALTPSTSTDTLITVYGDYNGNSLSIASPSVGRGFVGDSPYASTLATDQYLASAAPVPAITALGNSGQGTSVTILLKY
jgi:type II secretory pathway pseudopilin PulG